MNEKRVIGVALLGIALTTGTLARAHAERGDSRDHGMGMTGMMSQMQAMMSQCSDMMDRMMEEPHAADHRGDVPAAAGASGKREQ